MTDLSDDERAAFEAAFRNYFGSNPEVGTFDQAANFWLARLDDGRYEITRVEDAWTGWRAAGRYYLEMAAKLCEEQTMLGPAWREMFAAAIRSRIEGTTA